MDIFNSNGVLNVKEISGIPVKVMLVNSKGSKNVRTGKFMNPIGITVHNTGNTSASAGAEQHAKYLQNVENADELFVSWHFSVDCDCIIQHLPVNETAFHAGDGNGVGNSKTIAIEICENKNYDKAEKNAIELIKAICISAGWGSDVIKPHRFFASNKKLCPHRILKNEANWQENWTDWINTYFSVLDKKIENKKNYSDWAIQGIQWALDSNLVAGSVYDVNWREPITLERFLTILYRYNNKYRK